MRKEEDLEVMDRKAYSHEFVNTMAVQNTLKRIMDICGSLFFIIVFAPLSLFIAVVIKLDSAGPIFFLQKRCGKGGKELYMYKFRTMVNNAGHLKKKLKNEVDGPMFKVKNDPRVTKVGKFLRTWSLDELPQLLNVLKGEMSLVGPRPLAREEMDRNNRWMETRLTVKPGMTGLWQIKGRSTHQFRDWIKYDIEYVQKWSLLMDIKILFLTIPAVLRRNGAH
ncbi:MAG: sugar transferase [Nitrospirae bacterium]|nr:sugar transferase [Nitrospirota bacterium]